MATASTRTSAEEIRNHYFGVQPKATASVAASGLRQNRLTSSAKVVMRECRKHLGQHSALTHESEFANEDLSTLIYHVEDQLGENLSEKERHNLLASLSATLEDYDILTPLISNPEINDIIIRNYQDISVQMHRQNVQTDLSFPDHEAYSAFVENLLKKVGKACTLATPVVDVAVAPHIRACITHESFSPAGSGPMITMRIARHSDISLEALATYGLAPRLLLNYLAAIVKDGRQSLLIAGEVGTGKTTLVRALASQMDEHEAILVIEDTHEVALKRKFVRTLLTREANTEGAGKITPAEAIRTGMRMAMNRIILGEMRCAQAAEAFIDVCSSGHSGISTIHSRSAKDAISRLELFLARAQGNVSLENIRRQIANAIGAVIYLGVDKVTKKRRVLEVIEIGSSSDGVVQLSPIFTLTPVNGNVCWRRENGVSQFNSILELERVILPFPGKTLTVDE